MQKVFKFILEKLSGLNFALIGTTNIMLQGGEIIPNDIDFLTDEKNIKGIARTLKSKISDDNGYKETEYLLGSYKIHFVSASGNPLRDDNLREKIYINRWGMKIPCMTLGSELKFYRKINSEKAKSKVKIIRSAIASQK